MQGCSEQGVAAKPWGSGPGAGGDEKLQHIDMPAPSCFTNGIPSTTCCDGWVLGKQANNLRTSLLYGNQQGIVE
jgi:hypothetical protein